MTVPWLIDTDPGIDDALALLLAFASPEVSVEAITSVAGNVPIDFTTANVHRILAVGSPDPASPGGAGRGRAAPRAARHRAGVSRGRRARGDQQPEGRERTAALSGAAESGHPGSAEDLDGPGLILEMAERFAGELVVIALGPLTNLAVALERDRRRLARRELES